MIPDFRDASSTPAGAVQSVACLTMPGLFRALQVRSRRAAKAALLAVLLLPVPCAAISQCSYLPDEITVLDTLIEQGGPTQSVRQLHQKRYQYIVLHSSLCPEEDRFPGAPQTADPQALRDRMVTLGTTLLARISQRQEELMRKSGPVTPGSSALPKAPPDALSAVVSRYQARVEKKREESSRPRQTDMGRILEDLRRVLEGGGESSLAPPSPPNLSDRMAMPNPIGIMMSASSTPLLKAVMTRICA